MSELNELKMWSVGDSSDRSALQTSVAVLVRQCSRWAVAAEQDKSPLIALLHANYAAGYLWALKDIVTEKEIETFLRTQKVGSLMEFEKKIIAIQDKSTKKVTSVCPMFVGVSDPSLLKLAGDADL